MNLSLPKRTNWLVPALAALITALFLVVMFALQVQKHNAFNTHIYDFARFSQAIYNTIHGQFLYESIKDGTILRNHFSPLMATAVPFLLIWPNERVLFLVQTLNIIATGLILYQLFPQRKTLLGLGFLLAFFLNPDLHTVTLTEFRRIVFGMPWFALGLYGLVTERRWLMLLGLLVGLLAKESIGLYMVTIGLFLLVFERDWRWGTFLTVLGLGLTVVISVWVIPSFHNSVTSDGNYSQLYYYEQFGDGYGAILQTMLTRPFYVLAYVLQPNQLQAIGRILLPFGFILPFIGRGWRYILLIVPYLGLMFLSNEVNMQLLDNWYMATVLPVMFTAVAVGWQRIPKKWHKQAMLYWLSMTLLGFFLFSPAPGGREYEADLYEIDDRDRLGTQIINQIPPEAKVASQLKYVVQLTQRPEIYHYPWISRGRERMDYFVLDRNSDPYPFNHYDINEEITNLVSDPHYIIDTEADGIYLLRQDGLHLPAYEMNLTAEESIHLDRVEVAVASPSEPIFRNQTNTAVSAQAGDTLRVSLYWEALQAPNAERTVSVRLAEPDGWLIAQQDQLPVGGRLPTSWWEAGQKVRDVYYLEIPPGTPPGPKRLELVLYDSFTQEPVLFAGEESPVSLLTVEVEN